MLPTEAPDAASRPEERLAEGWKTAYCTPKTGTSFFRTTHAEGAFVCMERDLIAVERLSFIEVEAPRPARRMAAIIIFLVAAPLIAGQEQVSFYMPCGSGSFAGRSHESGSVGVLVIDAFQFSERRKSPVRIPCQPQITAVLHRVLPGYVSTVILPSPHQARGWIDPEAARLSILRAALAFRCRLSAPIDGSDREQKYSDFSPTLHDARSYFQLLAYHWNALTGPKNSPILIAWTPPAFRMRVLLLWISAFAVS